MVKNHANGQKPFKWPAKIGENGKNCENIVAKKVLLMQFTLKQEQIYHMSFVGKLA